MREKFMSSALAWIGLDRHPNIVNAVELRSYDGRMYALVSYVEKDIFGRHSIAHYLGTEPDLKQVVTWAIQFCHGMAYAVSKGVSLHGDIKPENLMVAPSGDLMITDFGLAKTTGWYVRGGARRAGSGLVRFAGSPAYAAPEQFDGTTDLRSDIYSFGLVLFQLISAGAHPYDRVFRGAWHDTHVSAPVPVLESKIFPIIRKCLEKSPGHRYQDFESLRTDLERLYRDEFGPALPAVAARIKPRWEDLALEGASLHSLGRPGEALRNLMAALRLSPVDPTVNFLLGRVLFENGLVDEAISHFEQVLQIDPSDTGAQAPLALALMVRGETGRARAKWEKILESRPDDAWARANLDRTLEMLGETRQPSSHFTQP